MPMANTDKALLSKLDRLDLLLSARDPAIVDELWSDLGFMLVGSEPGEIARTREELVALFEGLFALPVRVSWRWDTRIVTRHSDLAWIFAEGNVEFAYPDRLARRPYRLVCILQHTGQGWRWRLFSGSEPMSAPS